MASISHRTQQREQHTRDNANASGRRVCISVVVPCYNEADNVLHLKENLAELVFQAKDAVDFEFVFVDDGSQDTTWNALQQFLVDVPNAKFVRHSQNRGLAAAIVTGIEASSQDIVCTIDSDCTYHPLILLDLIALLDDDVAMVTASPYHPDGSIDNVPEWRIGLSRSASRIYRLFMRNKLTCYTCCVRAFRRHDLSAFQLKNSGFVGIVELLWNIDRRGMRIKESPARLECRKFGQSKMRVVKVGLGHLRMMAVVGLSRLLPTRR